MWLHSHWTAGPWFYIQNARGCAKWQWNARDCVTGLHDSPGVQSSNISRVCFTVISHTPVRSGFYHIHIVDRLNCDGPCLLNLTQQRQSCIFFKFAISSIALLNLGETFHLKGRGMVTVWCTVLLPCCYDCESTQQHYDITLLEYVIKAFGEKLCVVLARSHNYMSYETSFCMLMRMNYAN